MKIVSKVCAVFGISLFVILPQGCGSAPKPRKKVTLETQERQKPQESSKPQKPQVSQKTQEPQKLKEAQTSQTQPVPQEPQEPKKLSVEEKKRLEIYEVFALHFEMEIEDLNEQTKFVDDLIMSDFDFVQIIAEVESAFQIRIADEVTADATHTLPGTTGPSIKPEYTVGMFADMVLRLAKKQGK